MAATPKLFREIAKYTALMSMSRRNVHYPKYDTLAVNRQSEHVVEVQLNRPEKRNALNQAFIREFKDAFDTIATDNDCRVVILSGAGKIFCAGLDLVDSADTLMNPSGDDVARKAKFFRDFAVSFQNSLNAIEQCPQPVIAAVHSSCIGGGVDIITCCDVRYCSSDSRFQIKEVDIGLAADIGTLQRLPKIVGNSSLVHELAYTARFFSSEEAASMGLVSKIFPNKEEMMKGVMELADTIATKSPVAIYGTKVNLQYSRDHTVQDSLNYAATWNMAMLQTNDIPEAVQAFMSKKNPKFSKL